MRDLSIRVKITLVILAMFVAGSASVVVVLSQMYESTTDVLAAEAVRQAQNAFDGLEHEESGKLGAALDAVLTRGDLREIYLSGDRDGLWEAADPLFEDLRSDYGITHWYFETPPPDSAVFLRMHNRDKFADSLVERHVYQQAVESGDLGVGKELGQTAFALRVVKPWRDDDGEIVAYVEFGTEIEHFLGEMKEQTEDDFALIVLKEYLDREAWASVMEVADERDRWDDHPTNLLIDATIDADLLTDYDGSLTDIPEGGIVLERIEDSERIFLRGIFPVTDAAGRQVGGVLVLEDITDVTESISRVRVALLAIGAILGTAFVVAMILLMNRLVFARLESMVGRLEEASVRVVGGDFGTSAAFEPGPRDEIGRFEEFFGRFLQVITGALQQLSRRR